MIFCVELNRKHKGAHNKMTNETRRQIGNKDYVLYSPNPETLEVLPRRTFYVEIWRGLPDLPFERTKSSGELPSLIYKQGGDYIWVIHSAVEALEKDPNSILVATLQKRGGGIHAYRVSTPHEAFGTTLLDTALSNVISRARRINEDTLEEILKQKSKKSLKGEQK